jgi:two-component system OmpR family sensor kinase/two-component system sensor histidine kinase QseC
MPESKSTWSLQRRVELISALAVCAALVFGVIGMEWAETLEDRAVLDDRLEKLAETIYLFVGDETKRTVAVESIARLHATHGAKGDFIYSFQVWLRNGTLLLSSPDVPTHQPLTPLKNLGFETEIVKGEQYRIFSLLSADGSAVIQVAEPLKERADDIALIVGYYMLSLVLPFGLAMLGNRFLLRISFRALDTLAARLRRHHLLDVRAVYIDNPPRELLPVLSALNSLFRRTSRAITVEQRFTSVAAHELRTPLAGIRAQAQLASRAQSQSELREALQAVMDGVDRASRVFDQLFDLTRIESMSNDIATSFQRVQLHLVYQQVMEELAGKAAHKRITINTKFVDEDVHGMDFAIYLLLRNLLSNAILYTPDGGHVELLVQRQGDELVLTIDDSGKGIPEEERERAFERFNRLDQHGCEGVGLGLSIVEQVVQLHGAKIRLADSPLGGLRVEVSFQRPG